MLYKKISELANCGTETIVLDLCCGTGTIGLCLARPVRHVHGIELSEDAVKDARFNAELNAIQNIDFHCGRAEKLVYNVLKKAIPKGQNADIVAILDPPRSGLRKYN